MRLELIESQAIPAAWDWMLPLVTPSLAYDDQRNGATLRRDLIERDLFAWRVLEDGGGVVITTTGAVKGSAATALWIVHVGGFLAGGVKARQRGARAVVAQCEALAKVLGCDEVRIEGRVSAWGRVLPEYELSDGVLRKAL